MVDSLYDLTHRPFPVDRLFQAETQKMRQGIRLFGIGELFHITQINRLPVNGEGVTSKGLKLLMLL